MKKSILRTVPVLLLLLLLANPRLSLNGARRGLLLWFYTVLPALLPAMLCSDLLIAWGGISLVMAPLRPLLRLLRLSGEAGYALLAGLLCGYPMGAKTTADFVRQGALSQKEGAFLLAITSYPSPMFTAAYLGGHLAGCQTVSLPLAALSLYLPIVPLGVLASLLYRREGASSLQSLPVTAHAASPSPTFDELFLGAAELMVKIGGYMMLYSILGAWVEAAPLLPSDWKPLLLGAVEMTTGIEVLSQALCKVPAAAAMTASAAFGGFSGLSQTNAVIKNAGLSIRHYTLWKLAHASLTSAILIVLSRL